MLPMGGNAARFLPLILMMIPLHSYDLIDALDALYPEVVYSADVPKDEFLLKSGERRLILMLKALREREQTDERERR